MENIAVIVQHGGQWNENQNYINFKVCGLLIPSNCTYNNLLELILNELMLSPESSTTKIEYQVRDSYPPFDIANDCQLMFYIELKKREPDFTRYPLCLTIGESNAQETITSTRSGTSDYVCIEAVQPEDATSTSLTEMDGEMIADYIDYAELISGQLVDISNEFENIGDATHIRKKFVISNKEHEQIELDQIYKDRETLKIVMSHYAIRNNFQFYVKKSCEKEYLIACLDKNCSWMMRASRNGQTSQFIIRKLVDSHTCDLELRFKDQRQATATVIADIIKNKYTNIKTKYTVADIIRDMKHDYKVQLKYGKAWRSKEKAEEIVRGNANESYAQLVSYMYMLHHKNPGSNVCCKVGENGCFLYVFVALNASMKGWPHCIPVVIVDGTFLKSAHRGTLLVAATQDAGGKIFPLAFAVVNSENDESWDWFFGMFRQAYGLRGDMTIISDRHESIIKAVSKVYPEIPHGFCIFHLLSNIKSKFKKNSKKVKESFFSAANAYTVKKFEYHMRELDKVDNRLRNFLVEVGYDKWARVHSPNNRYSNLTSNIAESLNSVIIAIRELPICTMLESLRSLIQKWSWSNRNIANATLTRLTNKFEDMLKSNYLYSTNLTVRF